VSRRLLPWALLALALAAACGCAYYNTFYSARKAWDKAMEARANNPLEGASAAELGQYDLCIRYSTDLLLHYPNSKYVDDAVLLIGKCLLGKGEYQAAADQFQLMCDSLPQSELVPEALTGKGQALIKLQRFVEAESTLTQVLERYPLYEHLDETLLTMGDALRQDRHSEEALAVYTRLIQQLPKSDHRYQAQTYRGDAYFELEEWDSARVEYQQVALDAPREEDRYAARLRVGESFTQARQFEEAITYYRQMQIDVRGMSPELRQVREPELQLRIAECEADRGEVDRAIDLFTSLKQANMNNKYGSAASYQLGYLYEVDKEDFEQARKFYDACATMPRSEFTELATERTRGLAKAAEYKKQIQEGRSHFDARAENAYLLAELYCFDMKKLDLAESQYRSVERQYSYTRFGPKAAYAAGWVLSRMRDTTAAESAFARVAARYPDTPFGRAALDSVHAWEGPGTDSLVALARLDTTNLPLPKPPEAVAESLAQAVHADSLRKVAQADSLRRIVISDSLERVAARSAPAARPDSLGNVSRPVLPPGSSSATIQAAELDSAGPPPATPGPPGAAVPADTSRHAPGISPGRAALPGGGAPPDSAHRAPALPPAAPPVSPPGGAAPPDTSRSHPALPPVPPPGGIAPPDTSRSHPAAPPAPAPPAGTAAPPDTSGARAGPR